MSLSDDFLLDPVDYCTPTSNGGKGKVLIVAEKEAVGLNAKVGYSSVTKNDRVSYCRIAQGITVGQQGQGVELAAGSNAVAAEIKKNPPNLADYGKRAGDWFPCYYLPWQAQATFRITLKHADGFLVEPRIFLTSTVDGCSVIIEGSPEHPTVYHLNDAGGGGAVPLANTAVTQMAYWAPKEVTMETRFQGAKSPKSVKQVAANPLLPALPGAKAVHAMDYLDVTEAQFPALNTPEDQVVRNRIAKARIPGAVSVKFEQSLYKPYGTVFGWKQNTTWRFFYQMRAVVFYTYRVTDNTGLVQTIAVARQCGFQVDEFWPNGSGVAVGKALVP